MPTCSRHALAFSFCVVFALTCATKGSTEDEHLDHLRSSQVVVLQRDEVTNSVYWVLYPERPDNTQLLFRTKFDSEHLSEDGLPSWLRPNTAVRLNTSGQIAIGYMELGVSFTYIGECNGHWAAESHMPKCQAGSPSMQVVELEEGLSTRERLMLYIYFCRNERAMACTLETLDTKCKGDIPECCGQFGWTLDRIVTLAGEVDDLPTVPAEARRRYAEATELLKKHHASKEDGLNASYKFHEVLRYAPWWRDIYYNEANALALAGYYCSARRDLHRYIATKPSEEEVRDAQNRIAEIDRLEASER